MSGTQWTPARLDGMASVLYERGFETAAAALRDFARVVSAWERVKDANHLSSCGTCREVGLALADVLAWEQT